MSQSIPAPAGGVVVVVLGGVVVRSVDVAHLLNPLGRTALEKQKPQPQGRVVFPGARRACRSQS